MPPPSDELPLGGSRCASSSSLPVFATSRRRVLESAVEYASVDEIWDAAIHVGGPSGALARLLPPEALARGREIFGELLGNPAGSFTLRGRAAAVRGVR